MATEHAFANCALAGHDPCAGKITGEHYISAALLKALRADDHILIQGTPWTGDRAVLVGQSSLTANILCSRHNSMLSILDAEAARFLKAIKTAQLDLKAGMPKSRTHTFDGARLERWFLKVCFMMWASGNFSENGAKLAGKPPPQWNEYLLGRAALPNLWGLYVEPPTEPFATTENEFEVTPLSGNDGSGIKGARFKLARLPFSLILGEPGGDWGHHRPSGFILQNGKAAHNLRLRWPEGQASLPITYTRTADSIG